MPPPRRRTVRGQGVREPERARMAVLSDLLGFQHFTCARGGTVERDFLDELLRALGGDPSSLRTKDDVTLAAVRVATGEQPDAEAILSTGGTVTNAALDLVIDGVLRTRGVGGPSSPGGTEARVAANLDAAGRDDAEGAFDALDLSDERKRSLRGVVERPGQKRFRGAVIRAYGGCAITACIESVVLDAAHIRPYRGPQTNVVRNGICLRVDLHRMWDQGLLAVHERMHRVIVHPSIRDSAYRAMQDAPISLPERSDQWPDSEALRLQREWCSL